MGKIINIRYNVSTKSAVIGMPECSAEDVMAVMCCLMGDEVTEPAERQEPKKSAPRIMVNKPKRRAKSVISDEQKADIVRRYKAGEGPKAIAESLGYARSTVTHIIREAGATEGRTGWHLPSHKGKEADTDDELPV